jgi:arylsulfatase A-like enzyme
MSSPPNVIYILSDDQRADYMGSAGHQVLQTPNLDQLAHEGVYFSNAFCTSPTCTPSRACHYTGQWERKHGINFNSQSSLAPEAWEASFPMQLKQHGYFTGWIGKNHVPAGDGGYESGYFEDVFDYWYGNHNHSGFYPKEFATGGEIYRNAAEDTQVEVFLEGALNFLQPDRRFFNNALFPLPQRPDDRPFCLCITFNLPHSYGTGTMQLRPSDDELYKSAYRDRQGELHPPKTYMNYVTGYRNPRLPRDVYNGHYLPSYDYVKTPHALRERQVRTCQTITGIDRMLGISSEVSLTA